MHRVLIFAYILLAVPISIWLTVTYQFRNTYFRPLAEEGNGLPDYYYVAISANQRFASELYWPAIVTIIVSILLATASLLTKQTNRKPHEM